MRLEQLERVIATYGVLRGFTRPANLLDIVQEVCDRMGTQYCQRTTLRDLQLLERVGIAESYGLSRGRRSMWQIVGPLTFFESAEVMLRRKRSA